MPKDGWEAKYKKVKVCLDKQCKGCYGGFPTDYNYCPYCGQNLHEAYDLVNKNGKVQV